MAEGQGGKTHTTRERTQAERDARRGDLRRSLSPLAKWILPFLSSRVMQKLTPLSFSSSPRDVTWSSPVILNYP